MIILRVRGSPPLLELSDSGADARESRYSPVRPEAVYRTGCFAAE
jgi:hypothetical protein